MKKESKRSATKREVKPLADGELTLKQNHTHAGKTYDKGTPVSEMNPSDSTIDYLKTNNII